MFRRLDAEFAMIIYDHKTDSLIAARDPIGIRPLFYGHLDSTASIIFASEAKNLVGLCEADLPLPAGTLLRLRDALCATPTSPSRDLSTATDDVDTVCQNIREKLIAAVEKRLDADVAPGLSPLRRAGLQPGVRHRRQAPGEDASAPLPSAWTPTPST